ncbi:hypothetical protein [Lactococcus lactis]|uniref:hypothetical protein n=1 Tax=Lactococcus lactis TaxID=1358 RepID=UPI00117AF114|nr:hypothetical protein [Lactococcus lactis]TRW67109.1 hypothetical protein FNJ58_13190 [Lactococcus lactis]
MDVNLIRHLIEICNEEGIAKYRVYSLKKLGSTYELFMNKKLIAKFIVTGYEEGYLETNLSKTPYQVKTVSSLLEYLTGEY